MPSSTRPISPHIQIYRPQLTSVLSITHRATGLFLGVGLIVLTWWLVALARGPAAYEQAQAFLGSVVGQVLLFLWTLAFFYHMANGVRHLVWDAGIGFDLNTAYLTGKAVVVAAGVLTVISWAIAYLA
jgi:succinate dehydrogenase / fumarate reductase, cytochrome b subunit